MPPATDIPYKGTPMPNSYPISPLGLTPTAIHPSVLAAEKLIYTYPRRFHDVEAAKAHIASICDTKGFKYGVEANASAEVYELVKSRVCYHVAVRAFEADEFYLNTPLKDGRVLRSKLSTPSHLPTNRSSRQLLRLMLTPRQPPLNPTSPESSSTSSHSRHPSCTSTKPSPSSPSSVARMASSTRRSRACCQRRLRDMCSSMRRGVRGRRAGSS
jgi:hypothetical protein